MLYCESYNEKVEDNICLIDKREVAPDSIKANGENIKLIIDKLYTLRAIISFISREIDKCYNTEHKLSPKKKAIQAAEIYKYFYTSYLSMFKDLINENDWENIDLFIYFLETESTSTLKDSIEQVNLYSHTGNIANVSFCASKFICNKIKNESNKIENAINNSIKAINKQNSIFQNTVITLELQNAIIEKSNATSKQKADEIAKIKDFVNRL